MIKRFTFLLGIFSLIFVRTVSANGLIPNPSRIDTLEELIELLGGLIRPIFLITFVAMLLWGAFVYLTARDSSEKVSSARKIILAAIIGFVIAVFAPVIVDLVTKFLGVSVQSPV